MASLPWDVVETAIEKEMKWLHESFQAFHNSEKYADSTIPTCHDCIFRRIAILIVSGKIKVREIIKSTMLNSLWMSNDSNAIKVYHGKLWHSQMIERIANHFKTQGYQIVMEPQLRWGRTDLSASKIGEKTIYVEVGTVSLFKLWMNLKTMENYDLIVVPDDNKIIEFNSTNS
jgi:hypothetical protein